MALAVVAEQRPIGIKHGDAVKVRIVGALKVADGQHDSKFSSQCGKPLQHWVVLEGSGEAKVFGELVLAKVRGLEELLWKTWSYCECALVLLTPAGG